MARESFTLVGGLSKRSLERRLFGENIHIEVSDKADAVTRRLTAAYRKAWGGMQALAAEMAITAAEAKFNGRALSPREIARMDRVDRAQFALERQIRELGSYTGVQVTGAATHGLSRFASGIVDQIPGLAGIDRRFTKPSGAAMEGLVLRTTGQITSETRALSARTQAELKDALFRGLVLGENPKVTARHVLDLTKTAFFGGLPRAKTIARTEIADAHRFATNVAYNGSDLVVGWKWLAQLGPRTCPACWALHNTFHEKTEIQYAHQNCRCTQVPVLVDDLDSDNDLGDPEEIFWGLPREQQLEIMGPGRLKALEGGAPFSSLAFLKHNPGWRPANYTTSVADLSGLAQLNIARHVGDVLNIPGQTNESILNAAFKLGGLTIQTTSGEQPTSGVAVAQQQGAGIFDAREFFGPSGPLLVSDWMIQNGDALDSPTAHMGVWYNHADGKVYLDVVDVLDDRDQAIALGKARNQIAVFDLGTFEEIPTGGTGLGPTTEAIEAEVVKGQKVDATAGPRHVTGVVRRVDGDQVTLKGDDGYTYTVTRQNVTRVHESAADVVKRGQDVAQIQQDSPLRRLTKLDYRGLDPKVAKAYDDALAPEVSRWGVLPSRVSTSASGDVGQLPPGRLAQTNTTPMADGGADSRVYFNSRDYGTDAVLRRTLHENETDGYYHQGVTSVGPGYVATHEYGHVLDHSLLGPKGSKARADVLLDVYRALGGTTEEQMSYSDAAQLLSTRADQIKADLSGYGSTSAGEMIADGYAVFTHFGPGASKVADAVGLALLKAYKRENGVYPQGYDQALVDRLEAK